MNFDSKAWYASKTLWVQIITFVISVIALAQGQDFITSNPAVVAGMATALSVLNIVLRILTGKPLTLGKS